LLPGYGWHMFGTAQGAGGAILTFLGGFHPQTVLADGYGSPSPGDRGYFHHRRSPVRNFGIGHSIKEMLNAKTSLALRLKVSSASPRAVTPITTRCTSSCLYTWQR